MNFTDSPFERMMKEVPRPGRGGAEPCQGCRYLPSCQGRRGECVKKLRPLRPCPTSGHCGPKR